jgi:hypothetical protein
MMRTVVVACLSTPLHRGIIHLGTCSTQVCHSVVPRYHIYNPALYDTEQQYYLKMGYRLIDTEGNVAAEGDANATLETTDQFIQVCAARMRAHLCMPTATRSVDAVVSCERTRPERLSPASDLLSLGCVHTAHSRVHAVLRSHATGERYQFALRFNPGRISNRARKHIEN